MNSRRLSAPCCFLLIALLELLCCPTHALAWTSEQEFVAAATNAIAHKDIIVGDSFGEELLDYSGICTNESLAQTVALVNSFRKICLFEETISESNLAESIALSSNVMAQTTTTPEDWHFWASRLLFSGGQALLDDVAMSYTTLTNAMSLGSASTANDAGTNVVMRSLVDAFDMEDLSCHQAFNALAGVGAAITGHSEAATNHVLSLPVKYQHIIEEILCAE